jgi:hypothetical protein
VTFYALENALYQWQGGEQRLRDASDQERPALEFATELISGDLRKRLGSAFTIGELADFYATGTDWAEDLAQRRAPGADVVVAVDAAFARYAREASDYAGGRRHETHERPDDG